MPEQEKPKSRLEILEDRVAALEEQMPKIGEAIATLEKATGKPAGLFGGKRERTAMRDTKTGKVYVSKAALGKALAPEAGTDAFDHFAFYKLLSKFPDRFVPASEAEAKKVWDEEEAERKAAEEAAAKAEEAAAKKAPEEKKSSKK